MTGRRYMQARVSGRDIKDFALFLHSSGGVCTGTYFDDHGIHRTHVQSAERGEAEWFEDAWPVWPRLDRGRDERAWHAWRAERTRQAVGS